MKTVRDILTSGTAYLENRGVEGARSSMQGLIAFVMGTDRTWIYLHMDDAVPEEKLAQLRPLLKARGQGVPLQHLLGEVEFFRRTFRSDARALIPRPETEELVELALQTLPPDIEAPRILDMGCGSGVIGISLALEWRERHPDVVLVDISPSALSLALENATRLGARVRTFCSDLFGAWRESTDETDTRIIPPARFHLITANLPYIPTGETLQREVLHDPATALFAGEGGLAVIERFLSDALSHLLPGGKVLLEVGHDQGERVLRMMQEKGYVQTELRSDLSGVARFPVASAPSADPE